MPRSTTPSSASGGVSEAASATGTLRSPTKRSPAQTPQPATPRRPSTMSRSPAASRSPTPRIASSSSATSRRSSFASAELREEALFVVERADHGEPHALAFDQVLRDPLQVLGSDGVQPGEQLLWLDGAALEHLTAQPEQHEAVGA